MIPRPHISQLFPYTTLFRSNIPKHLSKDAHEALAALTAQKLRNDGTAVSLLEHHLRQYTRRNTSDFFIQDRKSTRLNSSHVRISYAVFCLKKKKNINNIVYL